MIDLSKVRNYYVACGYRRQGAKGQGGQSGSHLENRDT